MTTNEIVFEFLVEFFGNEQAAQATFRRLHRK